MPATLTLTVRLTPEERAQLTAAAARRGAGLSEWARAQLFRAAGLPDPGPRPAGRPPRRRREAFAHR